jgi:hypothetical protein
MKSERILKSRIKQWKLGKKNTEREMQAAVKIAIDIDPSQWLEGEPTFRIRHRVVPFQEVRRYYHRKGINDPIRWLKDLPLGSYKPSPDVKLIHWDASDSASGDESMGSTDSTSSAAEESLSRGPTVVATSSINEPSRARTSFENLQIMRVLSPPPQFNLNKKLISYAGSYCTYFMESPQALRHNEPPVHMNTIHGRFGNQMQDGIFYTLQMDDLAFTRFKSAFEMVPVLLQEERPFALAQVFAIICELAAVSQLSSIIQCRPDERFYLGRMLQSLVQNLSDMANITPDASHPLRIIFATLEASENALDSVIRLMHKMLDCFSQATNKSWTGLYLRERYCDCLFHAGIAGERQASRLQLLSEQEAFYGKTRSNVLWTLTNVADDYLENYQIARADAAYHDAAERADLDLGGFAKAKIRFAAFEGLAKVAIVTSRLDGAAASWKHSASGFAPGLQTPVDLKVQRLNEAVTYLDQAEIKAQSWFDPSSRRIARVRYARQTVPEEIAELQRLM